MNFLDSYDPIIACSTSNTSNAAISVIRLSGFENLNFLKDCFSINVDMIKPRFAHYGSLVDREKHLDDIVLVYFKGPNSYNGENILELSVHGNVLNVRQIINFFISSKKFREAYPGEFSYRALRNKKLNISQVEGLDLLLNANSNYALNQGNSLLSGELQKAYSDLYNNFLNHKSSIEFSMDFFEDMGEEQSNKELIDTLSKLTKSVDSLFNRAQANINNLVKPEICILGNPNSGKSTFFNSLLKFERAIVSDVQGTTRDFLKENILINEVVYSLVDTAGIRTTSDEIEDIGIKKALDIFSNSFYKVLLINPFNFNIDDFNFDFSNIDYFIFTHIDMNVDERKIDIIKNKILNKLGPMGASGSIGPNFLEINAKKIDSVSVNKFYSDISLKFNTQASDKPIVIDRHINALHKIKDQIDSYVKLVESEADISIISSELNILGHCISELIGIIRPEEVLNNIFDNFCIGK